MKTQQQMTDAGYERVKCNKQRRTLAQGAGWKIMLTTGEDGFGRQTDRVSVVLYRRDDATGSGWSVAESRPIKTISEAISDVPSRMHDWSLCDFALTADVNTARDELQKVVTTL